MVRYNISSAKNMDVTRPFITAARAWMRRCPPRPMAEAEQETTVPFVLSLRPLGYGGAQAKGHDDVCVDARVSQPC